MLARRQLSVYSQTLQSIMDANEQLIATKLRDDVRIRKPLIGVVEMRSEFLRTAVATYFLIAREPRVLPELF